MPTNTTLTNLTASQTFQSVSKGLLTVAYRASGTVSPASPQWDNDNARLTISYDAATSSYTVSTFNGDFTFRPADRDASATNAELDAYSITTGNFTRSLALFKPGAGNPRLALTYTSYGALQRLVDGGSQISVTQELFVFGLPTPAADMPRTGSARYTSIVDGFWASDGDLRALTGTGSLSADFSAGTTSLDLSLGGASVLGGGSRTLGSFTGSGTISAANSSFSGTLTGASAYSGPYAGRFFGPGAAEAGAAFNLSNGAGGVVTGVIVGKK